MGSINVCVRMLAQITAAIAVSKVKSFVMVCVQLAQVVIINALMVGIKMVNAVLVPKSQQVQREVSYAVNQMRLSVEKKITGIVFPSWEIVQNAITVKTMAMPTNLSAAGLVNQMVQRVCLGVVRWVSNAVII